MKKTVLITGASTGIGRAAALYFAERGWNVAATMRSPETSKDFKNIDNLSLFRLDVTKSDSIKNCIKEVVTAFGSLDVLVNNAGYGAIGIFEKASEEEIQKQFNTNVFGVMNTIREILPYFRKKRDGTIINVTSMGGLITFPIYSVYHGTKWAVEGFSESLQFELKPFNIKIKCVEPGAIKTDFYTRSQVLFTNPNIQGYDDYEKTTLRNSQKTGELAKGPEAVAEIIYKAASDGLWKLRYPAGNQAPWILILRRIIPTSLFRRIIGSVVEKGIRKQL